MEKELMPVTICDVRGYLDAEGTAWLNVEDVARGLGFTQIKNGVEYVMWWRVNEYLKSFGFSPEVRKEDYIPENMFYRLAMKAKNEVAEKFQAKVCDEILPAIRKTGKYEVKATLPLSTRTQDIVDAAKILEDYLGLKRGIAFTHTLELAEKEYGTDLTALKALAPAAEHNTGYMNATQLGKKLGIKSGALMNQILETEGYQMKDENDWRLTDKGRAYAEEYPYSRNGHSGYQIRWNDLILEETFLVH